MRSVCCTFFDCGQMQLCLSYFLCFDNSICFCMWSAFSIYFSPHPICNMNGCRIFNICTSFQSFGLCSINIVYGSIFNESLKRITYQLDHAVEDIIVTVCVGFQIGTVNSSPFLCTCFPRVFASRACTEEWRGIDCSYLESYSTVSKTCWFHRNYTVTLRSCLRSDIMTTRTFGIHT